MSKREIRLWKRHCIDTLLGTKFGRLLSFVGPVSPFFSSCYFAAHWLCSAQGACKVFLIITTTEKEVT